MNQSTTVHNGTSTANATLAQTYWAPKLFGTRWSIAVFTLCFCGTFLNMSVIFVLVRQKYHRTGSGLLIINLVVIYFLQSSIIYPLNAVLVLLKSLDYHTHPASCSVVNGLWLTLLYAGNFFECGLAVNRVVALLPANQYKRCSAVKFMIPLSMTLWLASLAFAVPMSFGIGGVYYPSLSGMCVTKWSTLQVGTVIVTFSVYVPMGLIAICCVTMIGYFTCFRRPLPPRQPTDKVTPTTRQTDRARSYSKMLLISSVYCAACEMPQSLVVVFYPEFYNLYWSGPILRLCFILNPTVNTVG